MKLFIRLIPFAFCLFVLTGCVSREQADAKLVKGCLAGIEVLLPEEKEIGEIKDTSFSPSPVGPDFRHVSVKVVEKDYWLEEEVEYECTFQESFGVLNTSYTASIYQLKFGDTIIGKAGNSIEGSFEQFTKLTDAIRKAMYQ